VYSVPYAALPLSAGGVPVAGVPMVPTPVPPQGVFPSVTQSPAASPGWWTGRYSYPQLQPYVAGPQGTYAGVVPAGASTQGTTAPASAPGGNAQGTGSTGVAGVTMTAVQHVNPPAPAGGPHPLPPPPQLPVPQGFPNPFEVKQVMVGPPATTGPLPPGSSAVTGPMGYHPGLGSFAGASPFWLHLAWQLIQSPEVRRALGKQVEKLLTDELRHKTLSLAVGCLLEREVQEAFRSLAAGVLQQSRFLDLFAQRLKSALASSGLISAD